MSLPRGPKATAMVMLRPLLHAENAEVGFRELATLLMYVERFASPRPACFYLQE